MTFWVRCWLIAAMICFTPALANAGSCRAVVVHRNAVVVEKVAAVAAVVTPVVASFVPVAIAVPTFNAAYYGGIAGTVAPAPAVGGYAPQAVQAPCTQAAGSNAEILSYLKGLDQRLQRLEQASGIPQPRRTLPADPMKKADDPAGNPSETPQGQGQGDGQGLARATALMVRHCAACHDARNATAMGGKLTLTDSGKLAQISPETLGKAIEQLSSGKMPKGGQMTPQERLEMIAALVGN